MHRTPNQRPILPTLLGAVLLLSACATAPPGSGPVASQQAATSQELTRLGHAAWAAHGEQEALAHFRSALLADPSNRSAKLGMAEIFLAKGQAAEAEATFRELTAAQDTAAEAHQGLGILLLRQRRTADAVAHLDQAVELSPGLWRAWNALGVAADATGDWTAANTAYSRALALRPDEPDILNNAGVSALMQGDTAAAIRHLAAALRHDSGKRATRANLRVALAAEGRYAEALAGQDGSTPEQLNNIGYVAMLRGDLDASRAYLSRAIAASPSFYATAEQNLRAIVQDGVTAR